MEKYLRGEETARLAEGRRLIVAAMEDERCQAKVKESIEAGSSSTAPGAIEMEGYDPENPRITKASLLSPIVETTSKTPAAHVEKSSEGPETTGKTDEKTEEATEAKFSKKTQEKKDEATGSEDTNKIEGKKGEVTDKALMPSSTEIPKDGDTIDALKEDDGGDGNKEDDDVVVTGRSEKANNMTMA